MTQLQLQAPPAPSVEGGPRGRAALHTTAVAQALSHRFLLRVVCRAPDRRLWQPDKQDANPRGQTGTRVPLLKKRLQQNDRDADKT